MIRWWQFKKRYHCPHEHLRGIYGDEIIWFGWFRNWCLDCGKLLDGPVSISKSRSGRGRQPSAHAPVAGKDFHRDGECQPGDHTVPFQFELIPGMSETYRCTICGREVGK